MEEVAEALNIVILWPLFKMLKTVYTLKNVSHNKKSLLMHLDQGQMSRSR